MRQQIFKLINLLSFNFWFQRQKKRRLYVLMFHQVSDTAKSYYRPTPVAVFEGICQYLSKYHTVIQFADVAKHFSKSNESAVVISFDDGHADIVENCLPILTKYQLKFNVNIDTEILETGKPQDFVRIYDILNQTVLESYFDKEYMAKPIQIAGVSSGVVENEFTQLLSEMLPKQRRLFVNRMEEQLGKGKIAYSKMISKADLVQLKKSGVEVGSHSHTHPIFTKIPIEMVGEELSLSKSILENITGDKVNVLAYPNGQFNAEVEKLAKEIGFEIILKTEDKINEITNPIQSSFFRINQYYSSAHESIASMYGFHNWVGSLKSKWR